MKKKSYKLSGIDCANCALKIEDKLSKLEGMNSCALVFMTGRLNVLYNEQVLSEEKIESTILNTVSGVKIISKTNLEVTDVDLFISSELNSKVKSKSFGKKKRKN